jgi:uncharacterized protein
LLGRLANANPAEQHHDVVLSWMDGFVTAIAIGPEPIPTAEWLEALFPGERETPSSAEIAREAEAIVIGGRESLLRELRASPDTFQPVIPQDGPDRITLAMEWADGFRAAMELRLPRWKALLGTEDGQQMLGPILLLLDAGSRDEALSHLAAQLGVETAAVPDWLVEQIPRCVREIFMHWHSEERSIWAEPKRDHLDVLWSQSSEGKLKSSRLN